VNPLETSLPPRRAQNPWPAVLFVVLTVTGIFVAKWDPYFIKVFQVASTHTLGASIVTGTHRAAPPVGLAAAVSYATAYLKDIWIAFIVGLVVAAGVEALLPEGWLIRLLGRADWGSATLAVAAAVPSMMCTCCSAPIAVSLKRQPRLESRHHCVYGLCAGLELGAAAHHHGDRVGGWRGLHRQSLGPS